MRGVFAGNFFFKLKRKREYDYEMRKLESLDFLLTIRSLIISREGMIIEDGWMDEWMDGWMEGLEIVARLVRVQISGVKGIGGNFVIEVINRLFLRFVQNPDYSVVPFFRLGQPTHPFSRTFFFFVKTSGSTLIKRIDRFSREFISKIASQILVKFLKFKYDQIIYVLFCILFFLCVFDLNLNLNLR